MLALPFYPITLTCYVQIVLIYKILLTAIKGIFADKLNGAGLLGVV